MAFRIRSIICITVVVLPLSGCGILQPRATKPAPIEAAPQQQTAGVAHIVGKGETLSGIARHYSGDADKWTYIVAANPGLNPNHIQPGQELVIPFSLFAAAPVAYHDMKTAR